jgi:zinc transport system substrate-binding protein
MKKIIAFLLIFALAVCGAACGAAGAAEAPKSAGAPQGAAEGAPLQIVATIFPAYDWVKNVLGDNPGGAELTLLLDKGVDLHSFQPSADDILKISKCDLFLYVGGESDGWVRDALQSAVNPDMAVIDLLEVLAGSVREEELAEGMQAEEEEAGEDEEEIEYDEHVWLSLRNAATVVECIAAELSALDPANAESYQSNAAAYLEKLDALDKEYRAAVADAPVSTLLFGDRFPFRYLTEDYGLSYYAAFVGCSAETEASFETITFLAGKVDELNLGAVLTIDGSDGRIAETIVQNTRTKDQKILTLDSMQATTGQDVRAGASYLSVMEGNLAVLKEALQSWHISP